MPPPTGFLLTLRVARSDPGREGTSCFVTTCRNAPLIEKSLRHDIRYGPGRGRGAGRAGAGGVALGGDSRITRDGFCGGGGGGGGVCIPIYSPPPIVEVTIALTRSKPIDPARRTNPTISTRRRLTREPSRSRRTECFQYMRFRRATSGASFQNVDSASIIGTSEAVRIISNATPMRAARTARAAGTNETELVCKPEVSPAAATRIEARVEIAAEEVSAACICRSTSASRALINSR